jgi:hypothetical protein
MSTKQSHGLMPGNLPNGQQKVTCDIGHNGTVIQLLFNQPIPNLLLTPEQAKQHIAALQGCLDNLMQLQASSGSTH